MVKGFVGMTRFFFRFITAFVSSVIAAAGLVATAQPRIDPNLGGDGGLTAGLWTEDAVIGSINAPLVIVEYASWTCPHCKTFHDQYLTPVILPLVDEGLVRFVTRDLLRNWIDLRVSMAARCDGVDFMDASNRLYGAQSTYLINDPETVNRAIADALEMDSQTLEACFNDNEKAQWIVERTQEAGSLGVNSTPTVFVNGNRYTLTQDGDLEDELRQLAAGTTL